MNTLISTAETVQQILDNATRKLSMTLPSHEARLQAELLLADTLDMTRAMLLARLNEGVAPELAAQFDMSVARRAQHEPLAYILGRQEFYELEFIVDRRVLIPRHETELLVQLALERAKKFPAPFIIDVGTGSGAIALALAHHLPHAQVYASDWSPDALAVARLNASNLKLTNVQLGESDLLQELNEPFDLLTANLPYIPITRYEHLPREVGEFEPRIALDGGADGLAVYRRLLQRMGGLAKKGSIALLEISEEQGESALELVHRELPLAIAQVHQDLEGLDRVVELSF